jgi:hypothetical protein
MKIYKDISFDLVLGLTIDLDRLSLPQGTYFWCVKSLQPLFDKVKDSISRDEGLSRSMVYPKHKVMLFALIDFHRF